MQAFWNYPGHMPVTVFRQLLRLLFVPVTKLQEKHRALLFSPEKEKKAPGLYRRSMNLFFFLALPHVLRFL